MREDRNQFQIIRKDARNCFVESLNDSFSIGRIHLAFAAYDQSKPAGQRQTNNVHIYIAVDEFLDLCRKLECGELNYMLQTKKKNGDTMPLYPDYMGLIFEQMCREYLFLYAEDVPVVLSDIGSWWGTDSKEKKEVEIDIVGTPVEGNEYIIGSCKYKNSPVGVDELELLKHYADVFGKGEKYHYYIFSKGGFTEGLKEVADKGEVRLVTLQDMYK